MCNNRVPEREAGPSIEIKEFRSLAVKEKKLPEVHHWECSMMDLALAWEISAASTRYGGTVELRRGPPIADRSCRRRRRIFQEYTPSSYILLTQVSWMRILEHAKF